MPARLASRAGRCGDSTPLRLYIDQYHVKLCPFTSPLAWGSLRREITLDRLLVEEIVHHYPDALMRGGFFYHGLRVLQHERPGLEISHPLTQPLDIVPRPAAHVDKERDVESAGVEKLSRREQIGPGCL